MVVGAMEPQFYAEFVKGLGFKLEELPDRGDKDWPDDTNWAELREIFKKRFLEKTQEEWTKIFLGKDACVSPVLELLEATKDLTPIVGLSETPSLDVSDRSILSPGQNSDRVLSQWLGWQKGHQYTVEGTTVKSSDKSRL